MTHVPVIVGLALMFAGVARPASPVAVLLQFDEPYSQPAVEAMQREASSIMLPAGYRLEWHLIEPELASREYADLVVVHFRGNCDAGSANGSIQNGEALGSTAISDGRVLPFSEVQCDRVRRLLAGAASRGSAGILGRALGRIVAHEMFHMLAATDQHGKRGVARPSYTTEELVSSREFRFNAPDLQLLQDSRRRTPEPLEEQPRER
jgi:hypothetical protein